MEEVSLHTEKGDSANHYTIALISQPRKKKFKIIQCRLKPYLEREIPVVQADFRKGHETKEITADAHWISERIKDY